MQNESCCDGSQSTDCQESVSKHVRNIFSNQFFRRERLRPRIEKLIEEHDVLAEHNSGIIEDLTNMQNQVDDLTNQINALNFDADSDSSLCDRVTALKRRIDYLKEENVKMVNEYK